MNDDEFNDWRSHFVMSEKDKIGLRRPPYVFTEQGVAMLSAVINTEVAIEVSVEIINTFVKMRHCLSNVLISNNLIEHKLLEHDKRISDLESVFDNFKENNNHMFFEGQIYDAYSLLLSILESAKESIIIIDNYDDKKLLDLLVKLIKKYLYIVRI